MLLIQKFNKEQFKCKFVVLLIFSYSFNQLIWFLGKWTCLNISTVDFQVFEFFYFLLFSLWHLIQPLTLGAQNVNSSLSIDQLILIWRWLIWNAFLEKYICKTFLSKAFSDKNINIVMTYFGKKRASQFSGTKVHLKVIGSGASNWCRKTIFIQLWRRDKTIVQRK